MQYLLGKYDVSRSARAACVRNFLIESSLTGSDGFFTPDFQKQLTDMLGEEAFRKGVFDFSKEVSYGYPE